MANSERISTINTYKVLWYCIPFIWLLILFCSNSTFDIQIHDTYLVISSSDLAIVVSLIFGLLGLGYWLMRAYKRIHWLEIFHIVLTILSIVGFVSMSILQQDQYDLRLSGRLAIIFLLVFILAQLLFLINLSISLFRGQKRN